MSTETKARFTPAAFPSLRDREVEQEHARARVQGHVAGYAAGLAAAEQENKALREQMAAEHAQALRESRARLEQALTVLRAATTALNDRVAPLLDEAHDTLAASAVELAEAVLGHELTQRPDSARLALQRALAPVDPVEVRAVRLHPRDLAALDAETRQAAGVRLVADGSLQPGDAVADLEHGFLDARIGTALERARAALVEQTS